jgi:hypothetical protein
MTRGGAHGAAVAAAVSVVLLFAAAGSPEGLRYAGPGSPEGLRYTASGSPDRLHQGYGGPPKLYAKAEGLRSAASDKPAPSPAASRVVAIGDIHGAIDRFTAILRTAGLIDERRAWAGGDAVMVQTGDFTDRGAGVRAVLDLLMALQARAPASGGQTHILLGNHETMNLLGETRDVSPEIFASFADDRSETRRDEAHRAYSRLVTARASRLGSAAPPALSKDAWMAAHPPGFLEYRAAMAPDGVYGRWLRERRAAVLIDDSIFLHGGISPDMAPASIDALNRQVEREVRAFDDYSKHLAARGVILPFFTLQETFEAAQAELQAIATAQTAAAAGEFQPPILDIDRRHIEVLQGIARVGTWASLNPNGPLWFRGYATWGSQEHREDVEALLKKYKARRFIVGHTIPSSMRITPRYDRRIFLIDTGMLDTYYKGGRASALEIAGGRISAIYEDGRMVLDGVTAAAAQAR